MGLFDRFKRAKSNEKSKLENTVPGKATEESELKTVVPSRSLPKEMEERSAFEREMAERKKVMIINSNLEERDKISSWLTDANYYVVAKAEDSIEVVEMFYDDRIFDLRLVIIDMEMPSSDLDGVSILEDIRDLISDVPVLFTSVPQGMEEDAMEAGASAILGEHYIEYDLIEAVKDLIG